MKKTTVFAVFLLVFAVGALYAETWINVPLMDSGCLAKMGKTPDKHPRTCLIKCAKNGYGIILKDGKYLKFDKAGNEKALAALEKSTVKDHVRVTVEGTLEDGVIHVSSLELK